MSEMTTHERVTRMYEHREADRVPVTDSPWGSTIKRWQSEGMPKDAAFSDYFGLDKFAGIGADNSPQYPVETVEDTDEYVITTTRWGVKQKTWKDHGGVPEFLDFTVTSPEAWAKAKVRMNPDRRRVDWDNLKRNYKTWREEGRWINAGFWFGFDITHSHMVGTETLLMAMAMQPEWVSDMLNHELDVHLALFQMIWDEGYTFDAVSWPDDMGYKGKPFFSLDMYRSIVKPVHKRACDWAHTHGCKVHLHSCGDIRTLVPDLIDAGVDMLNPLEVKAGVDPVALKKEYGDRLTFHGGLNAVLFEKPEKLYEQMRQVIPEMKKDGGYIVGSDHSVPESVSLEGFREFVALAKELGSY